MEYEKDLSDEEVEEKRTPEASAGEEESSIKHLNDQVTGVFELMRENVEKAIKRHDDLDAMDEDSRRLEQAAEGFKVISGEVSSSFKRKNIKLVIAIVTVVVFIVIIIIVVIALVATGVIPVGTP